MQYQNRYVDERRTCRDLRRIASAVECQSTRFATLQHVIESRSSSPRMSKQRNGLRSCVRQRTHRSYQRVESCPGEIAGRHGHGRRFGTSNWSDETSAMTATVVEPA